MNIKILIVIALLCFNAYALSAAPLATDIYWKKLLHFEGAHSRVTSDEFFLSINGRNNAEAELNETIRLLNSDDGFAIACNFPARYQWIRSTKKNVPNFDLNRCIELQDFLKSFQKETLSIVFVSEFIDVPASAFGHIMLAFQNNNSPLPLADAIHFAAVTEHEGFLKYAYRGLTGDYDGFFIRQPLFEKQYEYNITEQRALHFYKINFSEEEISRIILHLYELRKSRFAYYFIDENCAFHIGQLLDIALENEDRGFLRSRMVLPIDVVNKYADRIVATSTLTPSLLKAEDLLGNLSAQEQQKISNIIHQQDNLNDQLSDQVKETLALHYRYMFRRQRIAYENFKDVESLQYQPTTFSSNLANPLDEKDSGRVLLGIHSSRNLISTTIGYRPMLRDIYAPQQNHLQESELSLFDIQAIANDQTIQLNQVELIKLRSLPKRNVLRQDLSWRFYAGLNRKNTEQALRSEIEFGLGESVGSKNWTAGWDVSLGAQKNTDVNAYLKPSLILLTYWSHNIKVGYLTYDQHFIGEHYLQNELFVSKKLGSSYGTIKLIKGGDNEMQFIANFSWAI